MNENQRKALAALEQALPLLAEASKLAEADDYQDGAVTIDRDYGFTVGVTTQDAHWHAALAIRQLQAID